MGDSAYVENYLRIIPNLYSFLWLPSEEEIRNRFNFTYNDKYYKQFRETNIKIIGTWDDHDYGNNDGNKYFKDKHLMRNIFLDFLEVDKNSKRRTNDGGIYQSYYLTQKKNQ